MRNWVGVVSVFSALVLADGARAEVTEASEVGFTIRHAFEVPDVPLDAYAKLTDVRSWWNPEHSYSGDPANFFLEATAGGCFCEVWSGGSSKHAEVLQTREGAMLRMSGALGPLQAMGLSSIHEWTLEPVAGGTRITYVNRVRGWPGDDLAALAPTVDGVQVGQMERLRRFITHGDPNAED